MFNVSIPKISDEELTKRYKQIKPVISMNGKLYYCREFTIQELRNFSYMWDKFQEISCEDELEVLEGKDFVCLHTYAYPGYFKPTISEVLAQINEYDIPLVKAFEIIDKPKTALDFHKDSFSSIAFNNGYHVSTVRLYGKKK